LRKEVNKYGIKVSLIEPGATGTDMQPVSPSDQRDKEESGEMLKAEDIAACIHYCLVQPKRCDVVAVQIRPHMQLI
jgi:NADP-dependent 3-hydroxy acid dehydrogenase YdfG